MATKKVSKARATKHEAAAARTRAPKSAKRLGQFEFRPHTELTNQYPIHRLPFLVRGNGIKLPTCSNYIAGNELGQAAAQAYMKALRSTPEFGRGCLQSIVLSMLEQGWDVSFGNDVSHRGVVVSFFSTLDQWLFNAAQMFGSVLDKITEDELEQRMAEAASKTNAESLADVRRKVDALEMGAKA